MSLAHPNLRVILGPPGTGKTHSLMDIMEWEIGENETPPDRIAYLTFTKKGAGEGRDRAMQKFGLEHDALPWFRTIHSLVFKQMGYKRNQVVGRQQFTDLGKALGIEFTGGVYTDDGMQNGGLGTGDKLVFLENLARVTGKDLKQVWQESDHGMDWRELETFARSYKLFKSRKGLVDYTDMLESFIESLYTPSVDVLIVDEAQDLSLLQWACVEAMAKHCRAVYIAGDDDQAIYRWAGADVETFIALRGSTHVLDQSHRIGHAVHSAAVPIAKRIRNRKDKPFAARDYQGECRWVVGPDELDMSKGTWLLLARNSYMLQKYEEHCDWAGVNFDSPGRRTRKDMLLAAIRDWEGRLNKGLPISAQQALQLSRHFKDKSWSRALRQMDPATDVTREDLRGMGLKSAGDVWFTAMDAFPDEERENFRAMRRRGEQLWAAPRVKVSTIHGVKGGQADNVVLMTDISMSCHNAMVEDPDDECRVFYVGMTRARDNLYLMTPQSQLAFEI